MDERNIYERPEIFKKIRSRIWSQGLWFKLIIGMKFTSKIYWNSNLIPSASMKVIKTGKMWVDINILFFFNSLSRRFFFLQNYSVIILFSFVVYVNFYFSLNLLISGFNFRNILTRNSKVVNIAKCCTALDQSKRFISLCHIMIQNV